ncbi:hypothetical protein ACFL96_18185, partial [Thermoproteota archaeon]
MKIKLTIAVCLLTLINGMTEVQANLVPGLTVVPGGETAASLIYDNGAYVYNHIDLRIPGRNGLDLVISRTYNSDYFASPSQAFVSNLDDILINKENFGKLYAFKFSFWMGRGWETNAGGYLLRNRQWHQEGNTHGWGSDPFSDMNDKLKQESIHIQLPNGYYKFYLKDKKWHNAVIGRYEQLEEKDNGYCLCLPNGVRYYFFENAIDQELDIKLRQNTGFAGWDKLGKKYKNLMQGMLLSKIENQYGDLLTFSYEKPRQAVLEDHINKPTKTETLYKDFQFGYTFADGPDDKPDGSIGVSLGAVLGNYLCPGIGGIAGAVIGGVIESLFYFKSSWGHMVRDIEVCPKRVCKISDGFGREVRINYRKPLSDYTCIQDLVDERIGAYQISSIQYTGVNGSQQHIYYSYIDTGKEDGLLKAVTFPTSETEEYAYTPAKQIYSSCSNSQYLMTSQTNGLFKEILLGYKWHDSGMEYNNKFLLISRKERDLLLPESQVLEWSYTYDTPQEFNCYTPIDCDESSGFSAIRRVFKWLFPKFELKDLKTKDSGRYGMDSYGFTHVVIRGPEGETEKYFDNGLMVQTIDPSGWIIDQEWSTPNRHLLSSLRHKQDCFYNTDYLAYDSFSGNVKHIRKSGSGLQPVEAIYTYLHESNDYLKEQNLLTIIKSEKIKGSRDLETHYSFGIETLNPSMLSFWHPGYEYCLPYKKKMSYLDRKGNPVHLEEYYDYDNALNLSSKTTFSGHRYNYSYLNGLYMSEESFPDVNLIKKQIHDSNTGAILSETGFNDSKTFHYLDNGLVKDVIFNAGSPEQKQKQYFYSVKDRKATIVLSNGTIEEKIVDAFGRVSKFSRREKPGLTPFDIELYSYSYNNGNLTVIQERIIDGAAAKTTRVYDPLSRLIFVEWPWGSQETYDYSIDPKGYKQCRYTDAGQNGTTYYYDCLDRLCRVTDAKGSGVDYKYDSFNGLISIQDRASRKTYYDYNPLGQIEYMRSPDNDEDMYTYKKGELRQVVKTYHSGGTKTIVYNGRDSLNNVKEILYSDGAKQESVKYYYHNQANNAGNKLWKVQKSDGYTEEYFYNKDGKMISLTQKNALGILSSLTYSYNYSGQVTSIQDALGQTQYTYDLRGRIRE